MEPLQTRLNPITRRTALMGMALAAIAPLGCFGTTRNLAHKSEVKLPPKGRLVSAWENKVVFAPDVSRGGAVMPGLSGRVFLFGPDMAVPYITDGTLVVDLHDATPQGGVSEPKMIEQFRIAPEALAQLAKKDVFGDGYTIFFPWSTYRPDISHLYIQMRFETTKGDAYFHQSGTFTVDHAEAKERVRKGMSINNPSMQSSFQK